MKKGQIFEGIIERVDFPNKGLVKVEEEGKDARYVTVKNAVPGQKVRFIINKFKKGNAEGRLLEVLETCMQYFSGMRRMHVSDNAV